MHKNERDAFDAVDAVMGVQQGASGSPTSSVAAVDPIDLKKVYQAYEDFAARHPYGKGALGAGMLEQLCDSNANIFALWYRYTMVKLLAKFSAKAPEDPFGAWVKDGQWHDTVFVVASTFPMEWTGREARRGLPYDVEAFLVELERKAA